MTDPLHIHTDTNAVVLLRPQNGNMQLTVGHSGFWVIARETECVRKNAIDIDGGGRDENHS